MSPAVARAREDLLEAQASETNTSALGSPVAEAQAQQLQVQQLQVQQLQVQQLQTPAFGAPGSPPLALRPLTVQPVSALHSQFNAVDPLMLARWRGRALRYVVIYLLLACALVGLRYQTREVYKHLKDLRVTRTELQRQQSELSVAVQSLTGEARVRAWALASGMVPYAQASKQTVIFELGLPTPAPSEQAVIPAKPNPAQLTFRTVWK